MLSCLILPLLTFFVMNLEANASGERLIGTRHMTAVFGHVHETPSRTGTILTTIECGHPLRVFARRQGESEQSLINGEWRFIKTGPYEGFILDRDLSTKKLQCPQDKYPKFFEELGLSITQMHFWARLYGQYLIEETELP